MSTLLWFRKGLRVHDNPALLEAANSGSRVFPVFCLDPWFIKSGNVGPNRLNFLVESLFDLDVSLKRLGSRLIVLEGDPKEVLPEVAKAWNVSKLYFEKDTEPYALERDEAVRKAVEGSKVQVFSPSGHTLWDSDDLIRKAGGKAPGAMKAFTALVRQMGKPPRPLDAPDDLANVDEHTLTAGPASKYLCKGTGAVPTLDELGVCLPPEHKTLFRGGESEGLRRMKEQLKDRTWVCQFRKPKGNPAQFDPAPATTVMSPYMKFGCVSCRAFYHAIQDQYDKGGSHSDPPESLLAQLLWREFFYTVGYDTPNFHMMEGNQGVRQIPWEWDQVKIDAWEEGRTGYPWIDAIMNQLRTWGWMHHLARHAVAAFLTRGDLYQHWEAGARIFDKYLIDADHFVNNGNWQWLSASRFYYQYFKCYSPVSFGHKYDPSGKFIRHFVPVLKDMPDKYIYEPWKAPEAVQRKAKCIIGKDYPAPIVDHKEALSANKARLKEAYAANREGADPAAEQKQTYPEDRAPGSTKEARAGSKRERGDAGSSSSDGAKAAKRDGDT